MTGASLQKIHEAQLAEALERGDEEGFRRERYRPVRVRDARELAARLNLATARLTRPQRNTEVPRVLDNRSRVEQLPYGPRALTVRELARRLPRSGPVRGRTTAHQPDCAKQPHHAASGWAFILDTDDPMALTHMLTSVGTAADPAPAAGPALATDAVPYEPTHRHP